MPPSFSLPLPSSPWLCPFTTAPSKPTTNTPTLPLLLPSLPHHAHPCSCTTPPSPFAFILPHLCLAALSMLPIPTSLLLHSSYALKTFEALWKTLTLTVFIVISRSRCIPLWSFLLLSLLTLPSPTFPHFRYHHALAPSFTCSSRHSLGPLTLDLSSTFLTTTAWTCYGLHSLHSSCRSYLPFLHILLYLTCPSILVHECINMPALASSRGSKVLPSALFPPFFHMLLPPLPFLTPSWLPTTNQATMLSCIVSPFKSMSSWPLFLWAPPPSLLSLHSLQDSIL